MKVPRAFFGTLREVKANCRKINTQLKKGANLQECISSFAEMESDEFPDALFWIDKAWSVAGAAPHFVLCEFSFSLDSDDRLDHEHKNRIYDEAVGWLPSSTWGTLVLNGTQTYSWVNKLPWRTGPRVLGEFAVLKSFGDHFDMLSQQGSRFYSGGTSATSLDGTFLQVVHVLARLDQKVEDFLKGLAVRQERSGYYQRIHELIQKEQLVDGFLRIPEI